MPSVRHIEVTVPNLTAGDRDASPVTIPLGAAWARRPPYEPGPRRTCVRRQTRQL